MIGVALVILAVAGFALSAGFWAASLRCDSLATFLLAVYLIAWVETVVAVLLCSAAGALSRPGLIIIVALWVAAAYSGWRRLGRPDPPAVRSRLLWLRLTLRHPPLAFLAIVMAAGYSYLVALGLFTPQNDSDPLVYQLTRAALWRQEAGITVVGSSTEPRLDLNPPAAEMGQAALMTLAANERFVFLLQLSAVAALAVGAFALARRVRVKSSDALLGALLVPLLPVIATQAISGYNDLVLASFVVAAAVFAIGRGGTEFILLALAVALALATKFTAPFLLPLAFIGGLVSRSPRHIAFLIGTGIAGIALGSWWFIVNTVRTGSPDGNLATLTNQEPIRSFGSILGNVQLLVLDSLEVPGATEEGVFVFVWAGLIVAALGAVRLVRGRAMGRPMALAGLALAATPVAIALLSKTLSRTFAELLAVAGGEQSQAEIARNWTVQTQADGAASWFGPLTTIVAVILTVHITREVRRRQRPGAALVLAYAPWLGILAVALALTYDPWRGRFLVAAWVMSVALWGVLSTRPTVMASVIAISAVTFVMTLVQYFGKPSGLELVSSTGGASIWSQERWQAQSRTRGSGHREGERALLRVFERRVPANAHVAINVTLDDVIFPYFGAILNRHVTILDQEEPVPGAADWLVSAPAAVPYGCPGAWRAVLLHRTGWRLYERVAPGVCTTPLLEQRRASGPPVRPIIARCSSRGRSTEVLS